MQALRRVSTPAVLTAILAAFQAQPSGAQALESVRGGIERMRSAAGGSLRVRQSRLNGHVTFMGVRRGGGVRVAGATPEARAGAFVEAFGEAFGIGDRTQVRTQRVRARDAVGMDHVHLRQVIGDIPVAGAELAIHLRGGEVVAAHGKIVAVPPDLDTTALVDEEGALASARTLLGGKLGLADARLGEPRLEVLNKGIFDGRWHATHLAWFCEASQGEERVFLWVDAHTGAVVLYFLKTPSVRERRVHDAAHGATLPGTQIVVEGEVPPAADTDAVAAFNYSGDTYDYFFDVHGRDSFDGAGAPLVSTVRYCPTAKSCPYKNAFWDSALAQMVYGDGFSRADDVAGHEITHAFTERTAGLYYYMQSGALNESFSDIFGETIDLWNTDRGDLARRGTDTAAMRWRIGEDIPGLGAIRDMLTPTRYGDPGKISDAQFACWDSAYADGGGVHTNSGVPNHAYVLMVDGGAYNGFTVTGIGLDKAARIEYRTLTEYLTSASDFLDAYESLQQACSDLIGSHGIEASDCAQVGKALDAVEMAAPWPCALGQAIVPDTCPAGSVAEDLFYDDMETSANWTATSTVGTTQWAHVAEGGFAASGTGAFWSGYQGSDSDRLLSLTPAIAIPAGDVRMQFNHAFGFENYTAANGFRAYWDGGILQYSINGGSSWVSALLLYRAGDLQNRRVYWYYSGQPLGDYQAFAGDSWGYTASQLDLSPLAGQTARFRFRVGEDVTGADDGWWVDDVRIYRCVSGGLPSLTVDGVRVREGDTGEVVAAFTVRLSAPAAASVTVDYATSGDSAGEGSDYAARSGTLTIAAGVTTGRVEVPVYGDTDVEGDESFNLTLTNPVNATIAGGVGSGTIRDDEGALVPPVSSSWTVAREGMPTMRGVDAGAGGYVAVGDYGEIWQSTTGATWLRRASPVARELDDVVYGNGQWVAVGRRCDAGGTCDTGPAVVTSPDGVTWTLRDVSAATTQDLLAVGYSASIGGGLFVAVGTSGALITSPDGISWTARVSNTTGTLWDVASGGGAFVVMGHNTGVRSTDGSTWIPISYWSMDWGKARLTYAGDKFVAVSIGDDGYPDAWTSDASGAVWDWDPFYTPNYYMKPTALTYSRGLLIVVADGPGGPYVQTRPAVDPYAGWTSRSLPGAESSKRLIGIVAGGPAGLVAVGHAGALFTSPSGTSWTGRLLAASRDLRAAASDGSRFCAIGPGGEAASSADGVAWVNLAGLPALKGGSAWAGIARGATQYVAVGPTIATSPTCSAWVDRNPTRAAPKGTIAYAYHGVAWGGSLFVAVGDKTVGNDTLPMLAISPDGVAWRQIDPGLPAQVGLDAVGYGDGLWVIVGHDRRDGTPFLGTSGNGLEWEGRPAPFGFFQTFRTIVHVDGRFAALSERVWTSNDGLEWQQSPEAAAPKGLSAGSSRLVAVGEGIRQSTDGDHWVPQAVPSARTLWGAAYALSRDRFVAVGEGVVLYTNDPTPAITIEDVAVAEGAGAGSVEVALSLSAASGRVVTVGYVTANGTALAGSDYAASIGTVTFEPGVTEQTISIPVLGDAVYERDETFLVKLSAASGATVVDSQAAVTLLADDAAPTVSITDVTVTEGHSGRAAATFTLTLSESSSLAATVSYATHNGTAASPGDFVAVSGTLTFPVGTTTRTLTLGVNGDTLDEPDETFELWLATSASSNCTLERSVATATIVDDDAGGVIDLQAASFDVKESGGLATVTATRSGGVASGVTVAYATADGTAQAGSDYTAKSGTLSFGVGVSSVKFTVPVTNDTVAEGSETVQVDLSAPTGGAGLGAQSTGNVRILDDDLGGTLQLSASTYVVTEGAAPATITVTRSGGVASSVLVDYATSDGSANAGADYTGRVGTLTFSAGATARTFTVPIVNDEDAEGSETVGVTLSHPRGGAVLGARSTAVLTIGDNEAGVQFSAASYSVKEAGPTATITVTRTGGTAPFSVGYATTAGGSASPGADFTATSGILTFASGVVSRTFTVLVTNDADPEGLETVGLTLENAAGAFIGARGVAVLTIADDEPGVQFSAAAYSVSEAGPLATVTLSRVGGAAAFSVEFATTLAGTASPGDDFTPVAAQTVSFAAGVIARTVSVAIVNDASAEGNESVGLALANPVGAFLGERSTALLTISDSEPGVQFSAAAYTAGEAGPSATVTVSRVGGAGAFSVSYSTAAGGSATAGLDYAPVSGTLTFGASVAARTFTVPIVNDTLVEVGETVELLLSDANGAFLGARSAAVLTIADDELGGTLALAGAFFNAGEEGGEAVVSVTRTGTTSGEASVDYTTGGAGDTAAVDEDYTASSGTLTFGAGETTRTFTVPVLPDSLAEGSETVTLSLSNVQGAARLGAPGAATLVIVDND